MVKHVFMLDDHPAIIQGLESQLQDSRLRFFTGSGLSDLMESLLNNRIDLLILDYELGSETALELIPRIREIVPSLPIIIFTMHSEPWIVSMLIKKEVKGIVFKGDPLSEMQLAVEKILFQQEHYYSITVMKAILLVMGDQSMHSEVAYVPSPREREVINLMSQGCTSEEISNRLFLTKSTVDTIRKNILLKSGAENAAHLMRIAFLKGWISA